MIYQFATKDPADPSWTVLTVAGVVVALIVAALILRRMR